MRRALSLLITLLLMLPAASIGEYRIRPGDTLSIFVLNHEEYNQVVRVRSDGKI
ncbi:sugar ABC transporter substrate-binding protein, partial [Candidatus Poribacteria bacterium]